MNDEECPPTITYRPATEADRPILTELMEELVEELGALQSSPNILLKLEGDISLAMASDERRFFLALADGEAAGLSRADILNEDPIFRLRDNTRCGYVDQMYVRPPYRKLGVGKQLLELCEDWFRNQGIEYSLLHASVAAVGFYARANYKPNREMFKRL